MPDRGNQGGRKMARVCDLFGPVLIFLVPVLNLVLVLVPVLAPVYIDSKIGTKAG